MSKAIGWLSTSENYIVISRSAPPEYYKENYMPDAKVPNIEAIKPEPGQPSYELFVSKTSQDRSRSLLWADLPQMVRSAWADVEASIQFDCGQKRSERESPDCGISTSRLEPEALGAVYENVANLANALDDLGVEMVGQIIRFVAECSSQSEDLKRRFLTAAGIPPKFQPLLPNSGAKL